MSSSVKGGSGAAVVARAALPIGLVHLALLALHDLRGRLGWTLAALALGFAALAWGQRRLARRPGELTVPVLAVAALLRLLLLPLPPSLSDDVLRYAWDGRVAAAGLNPYEAAPASPELAPLRDGLWDRLPHRDVATVYPPLAMAAFSIAARLPGPVWALKALMAACDLVACALLARLARRRGLGAERVVAYAWNPLVTLETAGMGHVDALGVACAVAVVARLAGGGRRDATTPMLAAAGVLAKLVPAVAVPTWARQSGRPLVFLAVAGGLCALAVAPVVAASGGLPPGLARYGVAWEFNGPVFEPLWRLVDGAGAAPAIQQGLDALKQRTGRHEAWNRVYPWVYPQLLAKLALGAAFAVAWLALWRHPDPVAGTGRLLAALLLCSATVYPWYLLWVLPWAALCGHRAWLAASALVPLSYLSLAGTSLYPWIHLAIWGPVALLHLRSRWSTA